MYNYKDGINGFKQFSKIWKKDVLFERIIAEFSKEIKHYENPDNLKLEYLIAKYKIYEKNVIRKCNWKEDYDTTLLSRHYNLILELNETYQEKVLTEQEKPARELDK